MTLISSIHLPVYAFFLTNFRPGRLREVHRCSLLLQMFHVWVVFSRTAEPMVSWFKMSTRAGLRNPVFDGSPDLPTGTVTLRRNYEPLHDGLVQSWRLSLYTTGRKQYHAQQWLSSARGRHLHSPPWWYVALMWPIAELLWTLLNMETVIQQIWICHWVTLFYLSWTNSGRLNGITICFLASIQLINLWTVWKNTHLFKR